MPIVSKDDGNILRALLNNKLAVVAAVAYVKELSKKKPSQKKLDLLSHAIIIHDGRDVGQFDHLHHWISGYLLNIYSSSLSVPPHLRKRYILREVLLMFTDRGRTKRFGGK